MDTRFFASQAVDIPVPKQLVPIQHYLRQPQRLVNALTESSRVEPLGQDVFRLKMRPLTFMMLNLQPTVDMRVWSEPDGTVHLHSLQCEIRGIEYINQRFSLNLVGKLQPRLVGNITHLQGRADLEVKVELPAPFLFTPKSILETTGNGLLKSVLLTVKQRLMYQLVADYQAWATSQVEQTIASHTALPTPSPSL